jgi:hypothetical protein
VGVFSWVFSETFIYDECVLIYVAIVKVSQSGKSVIFVDSQGAVFSAPLSALLGYLSRGTSSDLPFFNLSRLASTDGFFEDTKFGHSEVYVADAGKTLSFKEYCEEYGDGVIDDAMTSKVKKKGNKKMKYESVENW